MNNKGLLFAVSALLLVSSLLFFAQYYAAKTREIDSHSLDVRRVYKAGFVADDIESDFAKILGTRVKLDSNASTDKIILAAEIGGDENRLAVKGLRNFLETVYAQKQGVELDLNADNVADGKSEIFFSNGAELDFNYSGNQSIRFFVQGSDTNVFAFDINIFVNDDLNASTPWSYSPSGNVRANIRVSDSTGLKVNSSGNLDSALINTYTLVFDGGPSDALSVSFGQMNCNQRALMVSESFDEASAKAGILAAMLLPKSQKDLSAYYDSLLEIKVLDANVSRPVKAGGK